MEVGQILAEPRREIQQILPERKKRKKNRRFTPVQVVPKKKASFI
jgi:hypothetical protein